MFAALYFKEWREKALVFFFELGILVLLLGAQSLVPEKKDVQEWLVYAVLLLFFPFAALVLGAAGFESEYRQGAWAYLFSRPISRISIWLAKGAALLSMLGVLWLVFTAAWAAFPWIRSIAAGPRVLLNYAAEPGFPWWSVGLSAFFLVVSFSLSPLHERQFNILFVAVALGLGFPAAALYVLRSKAGAFLAWLEPSRALAAFVLCLVLVALAFAAASILTLARSDFSQPRRRAWSFAGWFAPFLVVAVAATAAWVLFAPAPGERYLYPIGSLQGEPCYAARGEVLKYSPRKDRVERIISRKGAAFFAAAVGSGKIVYNALSVSGRNDFSHELWVAKADGSGRRRIAGGGSGKNALPLAPIEEMRLSPDGSRIAVLTAGSYGKRRTEPKPRLWIVHADGSGFESLPEPDELFGLPDDPVYNRLLAWTREGNGLILSRKPFRENWRTGSLWLYDIATRTARIIHENAVADAWWDFLSPDKDRVAVFYQKSPEALWTLAVLNLGTLAIADLGDENVTAGVILSQVAWSPDGGRIAYLVGKAGSGGPGTYLLRVYSLSEHRVVAEKELTRVDEKSGLFRPTWTADGTALVVIDRDAKVLRVLGSDLRDIDRIAPPQGLKIEYSFQAVGDKILTLMDSDHSRGTLWRLDLKTKRWKRLY